MAATHTGAERVSITRPELRERIADYLILTRYDYNRSERYGDMARSRRGRELNRLGDALIHDGASREVPFITSHPGTRLDLSVEEIHAAFRRVALPRIRRVEREVASFSPKGPTKYTRATLDAWRAIARSVDLHDWPVR